MPYDHKNTTPDGEIAQQMKLLLEELNNLHCHHRCMIGSGGGSVGLVSFFFIAIHLVDLSYQVTILYESFLKFFNSSFPMNPS